MLEIIFIINSIAFPGSLILATYLARRKRNFTSISDFVLYPKTYLRFLKIVLILGNLVQALYALNLFISHKFPPTILLSTLAGLLGISVAFIQINKHKKTHIAITTLSLSLYTLSLLLTSFALVQTNLIIISCLQIFIIILWYLFGLKVKNLEVFYFIFFASWNLIIVSLVTVH